MRQCILYILFILTGASSLHSFGQGYPYCLSGRFAENDLFNNLALIQHTDVVYGINLNYLAGTDTLRMNIYEVNPVLDNLNKRPLVLLLHGGEFFSGSKADMDGYAQQLARRGYVAACIDYRLGWITNGGPSACNGDMSSYRYAAYRAIQDVHAALRFLVSHAQTYGIDTGAVYLLGQDAGATTALHVGFADQNEADSMFPGAFADLGGLYAAGNNLQTSCSVKGIFNWCGAVTDTTIFDANEAIPVLSLHGLKDSVFDVSTGKYHHCAQNASYPIFFGPQSIHVRMIGQGLCSETNFDANGEHCVFPSLEPVYYVPQKFTCFFKNLLCGHCVSQEKVSYNISSCMDAAPVKTSDVPTASSWTLSPNPARQQILLQATWEADGMVQLHLVSLTGQRWSLMAEQFVMPGQWRRTLPLPPHLAAGLYFIECRRADQVSRKLLLIDRY